MSRNDLETGIRKRYDSSNYSVQDKEYYVAMLQGFITWMVRVPAQPRKRGQSAFDVILINLFTV